MAAPRTIQIAKPNKPKKKNKLLQLKKSPALAVWVNHILPCLNLLDCGALILLGESQLLKEYTQGHIEKNEIYYAMIIGITRCYHQEQLFASTIPLLEHAMASQLTQTNDNKFSLRCCLFSPPTILFSQVADESMLAATHSLTKMDKATLPTQSLSTVKNTLKNERTDNQKKLRTLENATLFHPFFQSKFPRYAFLSLSLPPIKKAAVHPLDVEMGPTLIMPDF